MEKSSKFLGWASSLVALLCLVVGFGLAGQWTALLLSLAAGLLAFLFRGQMPTRFPSVMLALYLLAACAGLWLSLVPVWMVIGVTAALASWDLAQFRPRLAYRDNPDLVLRMERRHVRSLALALGTGLLLALGGLFLRFSLPFGLMALLILLVLGSLYRFHRLLH